MAALKTQATDASVEDFLSALTDPRKQADARRVCALMQAATDSPPVLWGSNIIGFGRYRYTYASGRAGEWFLVGFSPRKRNTTLYIMPGFTGYAEHLAALGKHRTGRSCLYINKLADVDESALAALIDASVVAMREKHAG